MRLIDADTLREKVMQKYDYVEEYLEDIDSQPTAYDVDKVVEGLEMCEHVALDNFPMIDMNEAIDIVKKQRMFSTTLQKKRR